MVIKQESTPQAARFDLSVGIYAENWRLLKSQSVSDEEIQQHLMHDIEVALQNYQGYHSLINKSVPLVDISLTKYY